MFSFFYLKSRRRRRLWFMALLAAQVGVFLRALTGRVMGISVGSVQTRGESKHGGGRRRHLTPHRQWARSGRGPPSHPWSGEEPPSLPHHLKPFFGSRRTLSHASGATGNGVMWLLGADYAPFVKGLPRDLLGIWAVCFRARGEIKVQPGVEPSLSTPAGGARLPPSTNILNPEN